MSFLCKSNENNKYCQNYNYKNKIYKCLNCNKVGHLLKNCKDPMVSYGIIAVKIDTDLLNIPINDVINILKFLVEPFYSNSINCQNLENLYQFSILINYFKYLLIKRRHSLGYMEFIRGRYNIEDIEGITHLFEQMIQYEIDMIKSHTFDELWNEIWTDKKKYNEYYSAKEKFLMLKDNQCIDCNLNFYINTAKLKWTSEEWGFPKGRKNTNESEMNCAIREFEEETGLNNNEYVLLKNINPLIENLTGTDGKKYKHIYYISIITTDKKIEKDKNNLKQFEEIGDLDLFFFNDAHKLIRPYHIEKKKILSYINVSLVNFFIKNQLVKI
jgi:8-oxo-dGTP pyrophosphatase MutT (NUDIX family)